MSDLQAAKFIQQTVGWRMLAMQKFGESSEAVTIAANMEAALASLAFGMSGVSWAHVRHATYYPGLVVSVIRTHFRVIEMARAAEVHDGTTLLRKQLEAVARLRELDQADANALTGKTPNLAALKTEARRLYGSYSGIAHSSVVTSFQLLGSGENGATSFTSVYPKFTNNCYVLLHNAAMVFIEFMLWVQEFFPAHGLPFGSSAVDPLIQSTLDLLLEWDPYPEP